MSYSSQGSIETWKEKPMIGDALRIRKSADVTYIGVILKPAKVHKLRRDDNADGTVTWYGYDKGFMICFGDVLEVEWVSQSDLVTKPKADSAA